MPPGDSSTCREPGRHSFAELHRQPPGVPHEVREEDLHQAGLWGTLAHLLFASDAWLGNAVLEDETPHQPLGLPAGGMPADATPKALTSEVVREEKSRARKFTPLVPSCSGDALLRSALLGFAGVSLDDVAKDLVDPGH